MIDSIYLFSMYIGSIFFAGPTVTFHSIVGALQNEVDYLKSQGVNKIIALGHAGYAMDQTVARNVDGVDIVVGGHTDTFLYTGQKMIPEK